MFSRSKLSGCAFCYANQQPFDHLLKNKEGEIVCQELLQYKCPWCHLKGHTTKHCSMTYEEVVQTRKQKVKQGEVKSEENVNSWAAKIRKTLSPAAIAKMIEDEKRIKAENARKMLRIEEEKKKEAEKRRENYDRNYEPNMRRKYGVKKSLMLYDETRISFGDFWEFKVEGTRDDSEIAKRKRDDVNNRNKFQSYLKEEYGVNWLNVSENSKDDCGYLVELRYNEEQTSENAYWKQINEDRKEELEKEIKEKEKEENDMKIKLMSGEISKKENKDWEWKRQEEDWEEEDDYHYAGLGIYESIERENIFERERLARKSER